MSTHSTMPPALEVAWQISLLPYLGEAPRYASFNFQPSPDPSPPNRTAKSGRIAAYLCPSDRNAGLSYGGCLGVWLAWTPDRGAFSRQEVVAPAGITDGLSMTAAFGEMPASSVAQPREERQLISTSMYRYESPDRMDDFVADCLGPPAETATIAYAMRCRFWHECFIGQSLYDHAIGINRRSCHNGGQQWNGSFTAGSWHTTAGAHVAFADGHVNFVKATMDLATWRALGTRAGGEATGTIE
jgi:prepilin-type processing-associated H-X9-DG protein